MQDLQAQVAEVWEERRVAYQEELEVLQLQREMEQAEHWLSTYEATLKAKDYGVRRLQTRMDERPKRRQLFCSVFFFTTITLSFKSYLNRNLFIKCLILN